MATRYSIEQLLAQADATLPDNVTQDISPTDVREMFKNFLRTVRPSVAAMTRVANLVLALTGTPQVLKPYVSAVFTDPTAEMVGSLPNGTLLHKIASLGNPGALTQVQFEVGISGANSAEVISTLYGNGVALPWSTVITTTNTSNVVSLVLTALVYATVDTTFDVRVSTNSSGNFTFSNAYFIAQNVPLGAFP